MAVISLEGMLFHSKHGVFPEEEVLGARYMVDVYITTSIQKPGKSDLLSDTIDYSKIYFIVQKMMQERYKLLEYLAYQLAHTILQSDNRISKVEIKVSKLHPPLGGLCNSTSVFYSTEESN
jgi:dihydroneopterin aldolase